MKAFSQKLPAQVRGKLPVTLCPRTLPALPLQDRFNNPRLSLSLAVSIAREKLYF